MTFIPKSRTQEYQNNDDGTQTIRCYSRSNPHYYKDSDGNYNNYYRDIEGLIPIITKI